MEKNLNDYLDKVEKYPIIGVAIAQMMNTGLQIARTGITIKPERLARL